MRGFAGRLLLALAVLCGAGAAADECPVGDLSGDCEVGFPDVLTLASHWLGPAGGQGDIQGTDGVHGLRDALKRRNHHGEPQLGRPERTRLCQCHDQLLPGLIGRELDLLGRWRVLKHKSVTR